MRASTLEFRLRFLIFIVLFALGFWAPWDAWLHLDGEGPNAHVWGMLSVLLSKSGTMSIGRAFDAVLVVGIFCACAAAWLRTWGAAYLGAGVVQDGAMHGGRVVADGPYRYVRNPLYLGTFLHTLALALLMPPSGAVFVVVLTCVLEVRLVLGEEAFLTRQQGTAYLAYCDRVPRMLPALRARVAASGVRPRWSHAVVGEMYVLGVAMSFAVLGWRYNALLLTQCVVVWFGVSLVARAFRSERPSADRAASE